MIAFDWTGAIVSAGTLVVVYAAFAALIAGLNLLLMRFSGWYRLAKCYPGPRSGWPNAPRRWISGKIGWSHFRAGLIVGVDSGGLHIAAFPLLGFVAPAIYVPWSALYFERRWRFWWTTKVRFQTELGVVIELENAAQMVEPYLLEPRRA